MSRSVLLLRPSFTLVLHGWSEKFYFETLLPVFDSYFTKIGVQPHLGSIGTIREEESKTFSYRTLQKSLHQNLYHNLCHLSLGHLLDKDDKQSNDFAISITDRNGDQHAYILNAISQSEEAKKCSLDFLRDVLERISPCYGYSLEMPLRDDPAFFSLGMFSASVHGDVETETWQFASHAMLGGNLHRHGKFRHVFEINVLSPPHLANRIGDLTFTEWVKATGHGKLEQWKDNVWVWFVPSEDRVRCANVLQFNGLLTAPVGFENELIG